MTEINKENRVEPVVHVEVEERGSLGRVARITIDNAPKLNILNTQMSEKCTGAINEFQNDETLRVMILTGAGPRAFIGGADITEMVRLDPESAEAFITRIHLLCSAIRDLPVPVIAGIGGFCLGAGLEVAAACDLRIATEDSIFGMPEVKVGAPSVIEAALLPRLVGWGRACEIVYTGRTFPASDALSWGLIERMAPREKLDEEIEKWVKDIVQSGPRAIRLQKALLRQWESLPPDQAIEKGIQSFRRGFETGEPQEFMGRFMERKR